MCWINNTTGQEQSVHAFTCSSSVPTVATAPPSAMQRYWLPIQSALSWLNEKHFSPWGIHPAGHGLHSRSEKRERDRRGHGGNNLSSGFVLICFELQMTFSGTNVNFQPWFEIFLLWSIPIWVFLALLCMNYEIIENFFNPKVSKLS